MGYFMYYSKAFSLHNISETEMLNPLQPLDGRINYSLLVASIL